MKQILKNKSGFTLIEAITFLFIFSLITLVFYELYTVGIKHIIDSKNRLGAISVANEKMEIARNLEYEDIGTGSGAVSGVLPENEYITENSSQFHVHTLVEFVDDELDGTDPTDTIYEDYKKLTITVFWSNDQEQIQMSSIFVPKGLEVANTGEGILVINVINVFSDQPGGTGIPGATLDVENTETGLDTTVSTDGTGSVTLMGDKIKDSIESYKITIFKDDHETVNTLPPYPTTAYDPIDVHASVVTGSMNVKNIVQNKLADLKVSTVDYLDNPVPNVNFHIEGGRKMGVEVNDPVDLFPIYVYNCDSDDSTGSSGEKDLGEVSPGLYEIALLPTETDYVLIDLVDGTSPVSPISLSSNQDLTIKARLAEVNSTSLLVRVFAEAEDDDGPPLEGAEVRVSNTSGYDETVETSVTGTAFFPISTDGFLPGDYDIEITREGYADDMSTVIVVDSELKTINIEMTSL